jgi:endo-1,4-beta-xylanase
MMKIDRYSFVCLFLMSLILLGAVSIAAPKPPSLLSADDPLPDPLVMKDGTRVTTPSQWEARRKEMLEDILAIQFGHMPKEIPKVVVVSVTDDKKGSTEDSQRRVATFTTGPKQDITIRVILVIPKQATGPFPVIVKLGGDHPDETGVNKRSYAIALVDTGQLDPGREGKDIVGPCQKAYPDLDWGSLATWAWGASRTLDFLGTQKQIDTSRAIVTGHSRTGKAALLAGVTDERFKVVVPNGSGCGGAATYRNYRAGAETLELLTREERWLFWMHKDIRRFVGREQTLPFDQHFMRALVAPRVVLSNDGYDDTWANNFGTQVCYQGAQSVFDLLGVPKNNLAKFREGGHTFNSEDADVMLDVADWHFNDGDFPMGMNNMPDPNYELRLFPFVKKER